ncbi:MAG: BirA family transcriptional regulator, partial [Pseudonocardiales bacterium]|nr:BirA family transcriptional regulator [Pseudonocardiales bacterium]
LLAGVALHDAVAVLVPCVLKWPNDLLAGADEAKLAGVLAQTSDAAVVIGIGLNVTTARTDLPEHATSLALCGASADRTTLLATILLELADRYDAWTASDGDAEACGLAAAYRAACSTLGREVTVEAPGAVVRGRGVEVDPTGRLVIEVGGDRRAVAAGDVTHVR